MDPTEFLFAILALLMTPGPTNTLLALAGAGMGLRRSLRLIPAEIAAYLAVIVPLAFLGAALMESWPFARNAVAAAAGIWVMVLAVRLWQTPAPGRAGGAVTLRRVFVTTLLNPKALIFGLVLMPAGTAPEFAPRAALFALSVVAVATGWAAAGALLNRRSVEDGPPPLLRRAAAGWLALLSVGLLAGAIPA